MGLRTAIVCVLAAGVPGLAARQPTTLQLSTTAGLAGGRRYALESTHASASRRPLLFGFTQRDKAAHDEHRDAAIEVCFPTCACLGRRAHWALLAAVQVVAVML